MYESASGRARGVVRALVAVVVLDVLAAVTSLNDYFVIQRELDEPGQHLDAIDQSDAVTAIVGVGQFVVFVTAAVLWVRWQQRAYRNLPALGITEPRYTTGQTGWAYFIPFLNLVRPKKVTNDLWRSGEPGAPREDPGWDDRPLAGVLTAWWALWVLAGFVGQAVGRAFISAETLEDYQQADIVDVVSSGFDLLAVIPAVLVIRAVTERQDRRAAELAASAPPAPTFAPPVAGDGPSLPPPPAAPEGWNPPAAS